MGDALDSLAGEFERLAAETRAREARVRQLAATSRRLQAEAADLRLCVNEVELLGSAASVGRAFPRYRAH